MRNHDSLPGEPVEWRDAYAYANELIKDGILERELVIYQLSMFEKHEPEEAFEWLVNVASKKHINSFEDDSDISTTPFLNKKQKDQEPTVELRGYLENNYLGPINKKKFGGMLLKVSGCLLIGGAGLGVVKRLAETGEVFSSKFSDSITQAAAIIIGGLLVSQGIELDND